MKKLLTGLLIASSAVALTACGGKKETLRLLNWGDYISEDVVKGFEKENHCKVKLDLATSNEEMYSNIRNHVADYDIVVPSDYMLEKLYQENYLVKIDKTKLTNYKEGMFREKLQDSLDTIADYYGDYFMPYFWGSLGIMYNSTKTELEPIIKEKGFSVFFEDCLPKGTTIGMYDCARDAFAAAQIHLDYSLNSKDDEELKACRDILKANKSRYTVYGNDNLKTGVANGTLDLALVYSGDYFDQRYQYIEAEKDVNFKLYCPTEYNNVFSDAIAIPTTSKNIDLAHKFIDYLLDSDNSFDNADYVGYSPVIEDVYQMFLDCADPESEDFDEYYQELMAIEAFEPSHIVKSEFYRYLGADIEAKYEEYFLEARQ